jgi:transposase
MVPYIRNREELEHTIILRHAEGCSLRSLSQHFGMARNTIRRIIRKNHSRRDQGHDVLAERKPIKRQSKLDPYMELMKRLIAQYPKITGVRLYEELTAHGFAGKKTIVTDCLRKIRPRPKREPVVRFETEPGRQGQMDWSPYTLRFTKDGKKTVQCYSYILGFSRRQHIDFTENRKFFTLIRRHQDTFAYFGGVAETCLYDGEKTVVLRWEAGRPVFNPAFVAFITHYHCRPIACMPGRPETKGKIEAPFYYVERNQLNGRTFSDLEDLRATAKWWLANRSDVHVHETTKKMPIELFLNEEKAALRPLPANPYDSSEVALRVCRVDGFLEHETNLYSVPYEYVADILTFKATEKEVFIYSPELDLICRHPRHPVGKGMKEEDPSHHKSQKNRFGLEPVKEAFTALGHAAGDFLSGLKQRHPHHCGFQARCILRLKEDYHSGDINAALTHALKYYAFDAKAVERILKARYKKRPLESLSTRKALERLESLPVVKQRPLSDYCDFLNQEEPADE